MDSSEEEPVDDPQDVDFELHAEEDEDGEEDDEDELAMDEAPPRRRRSVPRVPQEDELVEDEAPRRRRSPPREEEDEPPRRRRSPPREDEDEAPREADAEEPTYTDTGRRKRGAAKKVNYDDAMTDRDFFQSVNEHDAVLHPNNGHVSEGDDPFDDEDDDDLSCTARHTEGSTATAKKWKAPTEPKKRGRPRKVVEEPPPVEIDPTDGAAQAVAQMQKPPYDILKTPWANRDPEVFAQSSTIEKVEGRQTWKDLLPEMMWVCNEAARRQAVVRNRGARYFDKPLAADYMYDRVALAADKPWGLVCRDNATQQMQGFCMLGTFASWDRTLRWASRDPRAWGVADYDPNCGRRIRVNAKKTSDDEFDQSDDDIVETDPRARADEKKLRAYIAAATQAAQAAANHAMAEKRDTQGELSDALEGTARQVCSSDARMTEWPDVLEVSLLGGLGCGGLLLGQCLQEAKTRIYTVAKFTDKSKDDDEANEQETRAPPTYVAFQATEAAVPFYERHGFVRVGALAKYRDRRDMPELAYRHWNDRIMVSQTHGASHMLGLKLAEYGAIQERTEEKHPKACKPDPEDSVFREKARGEVMDVARSAIGCNTNVIGGSGVFRELVVLAQGRAGPWGANADELSRCLARVLVVFKSNACGSAKSVLRDEVLGGEECGFLRRRSKREPKHKKLEAYEDPDHAPPHMRTQAVAIRVRCPTTDEPVTAVEAVEVAAPPPAVEVEPEEEMTPEELACEACRGRHVKHSCGTDPEERKERKQKKDEAQKLRAELAAQQEREAELAREAAREAGKTPRATLPALVAVIGSKKSSSRDTTVAIRVKLVGVPAVVPVALFPKKLKKKAQAPALIEALAAIRRRQKLTEPPSLPPKKPGAKKQKRALAPPEYSPPKKLRKPPRAREEDDDEGAYKAPPLQPSEVLSDCPSDVDEDILSRPDNGVRIRFKWDAPYGWGEARIRRNAFKKETLRDDRSVQVPKDRTWLIVCEDGEQMLVALNPEFRGTSRRHNWYAAQAKSRHQKRRGPPRSRASMD